jgi:hypothetical protein
MTETKTLKIYNKEGLIVKEEPLLDKTLAKNFLRAGTKVKFNQPPHLNGAKGEIVGLSATPKPEEKCGILYIIKCLDTEAKIYDKKSYPYDYFVLYECMFDVIEETK